MNKRQLLLPILIYVFVMACSPTNPPATVASGNNDPAPEQPVAAPPVQDDADRLAFTLWQEPQTGAFTANVPAVWQVTGGVNNSDGMYHPWMELASPDGNALIQYGHAALQLYLLPHPALGQAGYPEGATIALDNGAVISVAAPQTGEQAAEAAVRAGVQPLCPDLTIDYTRNLERFSLDDVETSKGVVGFHCTFQGSRLAGQYYATTRKIIAAGAETGIWLSDSAAGYLALSGYEAQAEAALSALSENLYFDPQWVAGLNTIPGVPNGYYSTPEQTGSSELQFF